MWPAIQRHGGRHHTVERCGDMVVSMWLAARRCGGYCPVKHHSDVALWWASFCCGDKDEWAEATGGHSEGTYLYEVGTVGLHPHHAW